MNELLDEHGPAGLLSELQQYLSSVVRLTDQYGGFLAGNDIYSLGLKLIVIFGAPVAHEQDAANALRFALELNRELEHSDIHLRHRIGINSGFVFAGDVGPPYHRQYTVMGDAVNLAARLMSAGSPGQMLLSKQLATEAGDSFILQELPPIFVKGKEAPIPICQLEGEHTIVPGKTSEQAGALLGREAEVDSFKQLCHLVERGNGRTVVISGNAGIGKSRLFFEFQEHLRTHGWTMHHGACYSYAAAKPFAPWIHVLNSFFAIDPADSTEIRSEKVLTLITQLKPDLMEIASLLNSLLGLDIEQSDIVRSLDDEARRHRLFELITELFQATSAESTTAILLEDLHWADHSSLQLVNHIGASVGPFRLLLCLTHRPVKGIQLKLPSTSTTTFALTELPQEAASQLVKTVLDRAELPEHVLEAILSKARGNPLFLEEVARSISESGTLDQVLSVPSFRAGKEMAALDIPDRIQALIMSRIDALKDTTKEVLRSASVIGNTFDIPTLRCLLEPGTETVSLESQLHELVQFDFAVREEEIRVLPTVHPSGAGGIRTPYLLTASQTLSQLSYSPISTLYYLCSCSSHLGRKGQTIVSYVDGNRIPFAELSTKHLG